MLYLGIDDAPATACAGWARTAGHSQPSARPGASRKPTGHSVLRSPLQGAGTEVIDRYQLPMVGVPDPVAIAKTCSAVIPLPTPALTVGSVTEATVLPACSGTDAK